MTASVLGYERLEPIETGVDTLIYRGYRPDDGTSAILKIIASETPTIEELTQLRNEYEICKNLEIPGIVKAFGVRDYHQGLALILEDFGGESLKRAIAAQPLTLSEFLHLAIELTRTLGQLHQHHIIHKDIKPQNLIVNRDTREIKITDFSIATRLSVETVPSHANLVEGTLAYMSPEQTGRMNRILDYRTDFYSLGATFYEMLTGQLPFNSTEPLELVYCQIAKSPIPPHQIDPEIPPAVSDIVMKLMAKTAEERYQTSDGLLVDLENCLTQWENTGTIEQFSVGDRDRASQLLIPQTLYGRESEVATLMETFQRVAACSSELMLVSGYSGIGKSALVQEVHKPIVAARGYFIAGKYDQYKRNIPYAGLIQAFSELIGQLLRESAEKIGEWKRQLLAALGENGQVIIEVIPEMESIIGPQPPVTQLGPTESQNRFNRVFKQFVHVFCQKEHPLTIFLDDLQWADSASLKLIHLAIADSDSEYLLLIGAYRDNEVDATHPLMQTLDRIQQAGCAVNHLVLRPLAPMHVSQLVADTLNEPQRSQPLAELIYNKTQGNPFFLTQLLKTLYKENLLVYHFTEGRWEWDLQEIQAIGIADRNVVELMALNIQKLPENTQKVLKLAACIGNPFNLDVLAIVCESTQTATAADLWPALQAGLILPLSQAYKIPMLVSSESPVARFAQMTSDRGQRAIAYKFLHDRVQQAAYSLIPDDRKRETHWKIGKLLLHSIPPSEREEHIFALVNQLNYGISRSGSSEGSLLATRSEKTELAQLNCIAGQKAKSATAYEAAIGYFQSGMGLLPTDCWSGEYELTLALYVEAMEAEYFTTNFSRTQSLGEVILQRARTERDRVKVYELQISMYMAQHQILQAIETGLTALERMGVSLSDFADRDSVLVKLPQLDELERIPEMTDPDRLAVMGILMNLLSPVLAGKPEMLLQLVLTQIELSDRHSAGTALSYSWYGMILCGELGEIERGYQAGQIALRLLERFNANWLKCRVYNLLYGFIHHWKEHIKTTLDPLLEGVQVGLEVGDLVYVSYCTLNYCSYLFWVEETLEAVKQKQAPYVELVLKLKNDLSIYSLHAWRQLVLNLQGLAADKYRLQGESFDEEIVLPRLQAVNDGWTLCTVYLIKGMLLYILQENAGAVANTAKAAEYAKSVVGSAHAANLKVYQSLALLARYPQAASDRDRQQDLEQVEANQTAMQLRATHAPVNYQHKYDLVAAEKARVLGDTLGAIDAYERAISGAREHGYLQEEALAYERAAEFYLARGQEKFAQTYFTEAYYRYAKWGAKAKVEAMEAQYPQFVPQKPVMPETTDDRTQVTTYTTVGTSAALDLATVMKASQAISSELALDALTEKLMNILLENAGAQKGYLFLEDAGELVLAAEAGEANPRAVRLRFAAVETNADLPWGIINYVRRTQSNVVLNDAAGEGRFVADRYVSIHQVKSLLCAPFVNQGKLVGILYLENNLTKRAFTRDRLEVLRLLSGQAAISIDLARSVKAVQDTVAYLNAIVNNIADGLLVTDTAGRISRFNPALLAMFGLSQTQVTGRDCQSGLSAELAELVARTRENPTDVLTAEIPLARGHIGKAVATAIIPDSGTAADAEPCIGTVTIVRDITAEKEIDRMKTDFISTVSHELRTPLTSVVGFAKLVEKKLVNKIFPALESADQKTQRAIGQVGKNIHIIISEGERLTTLINDVLDIAKMEAGKVEWQMQPISISELMERSLSATSSLFNTSDVQARVEIEPELPEIIGDRDRLLQVPINLISNAVKFTTTGSVTVRATRDSQEIIISIIDTGIGIAPEDQPQVFEKFKQVGNTLTDKPKGTGLGLPICKQIVEHHGGRIWVESEPGVGSTFSFALPLTPNTAAKVEAEQLNIDTLVKQLKENIVPTAEPTANRTKTILVVDDDAHIRSLLRQELEAAEYEVREAKDGMDAISLVKAAKPDLILLDVMMPQIGGFDVAAVLKNDPCTMDIPIIMLSIIEDKQRGYRLGVDRYLTKPIDTEALFENIGSLLSVGSSKKKVLVVDEDASIVKTLAEVLEAKGYSVVEASSGQECIEKALSLKPDTIVVDSLLSEQHDIVKTLRFEKGLENVFFLLLTGDRDSEVR